MKKMLLGIILIVSMLFSEIMENADSALMAATKQPHGWQFASELSHIHSNATQIATTKFVPIDTIPGTISLYNYNPDL